MKLDSNYLDCMTKTMLIEWKKRYSTKKKDVDDSGDGESSQFKKGTPSTTICNNTTMYTDNKNEFTLNNQFPYDSDEKEEDIFSESNHSHNKFDGIIPKKLEKIFSEVSKEEDYDINYNEESNYKLNNDIENHFSLKIGNYLSSFEDDKPNQLSDKEIIKKVLSDFKKGKEEEVPFYITAVPKPLRTNHTYLNPDLQVFKIKKVTLPKLTIKRMCIEDWNKKIKILNGDFNKSIYASNLNHNNIDEKINQITKYNHPKEVSTKINQINKYKYIIDDKDLELAKPKEEDEKLPQLLKKKRNRDNWKCIGKNCKDITRELVAESHYCAECLSKTLPEKINKERFCLNKSCGLNISDLDKKYQYCDACRSERKPKYVSTCLFCNEKIVHLFKHACDKKIAASINKEEPCYALYLENKDLTYYMLNKDLNRYRFYVHSAKPENSFTKIIDMSKIPIVFPIKKDNLAKLKLDIKKYRQLENFNYTLGCNCGPYSRAKWGAKHKHNCLDNTNKCIACKEPAPINKVTGLHRVHSCGDKEYEKYNKVIEFHYNVGEYSECAAQLDNLVKNCKVNKTKMKKLCNKGLKGCYDEAPYLKELASFSKPNKGGGRRRKVTLCRRLRIRKRQFVKTTQCNHCGRGLNIKNLDHHLTICPEKRLFSAPIFSPNIIDNLEECLDFWKGKTTFIFQTHDDPKISHSLEINTLINKPLTMQNLFGNIFNEMKKNMLNDWTSKLRIYDKDRTKVLENSIKSLKLFKFNNLIELQRKTKVFKAFKILKAIKDEMNEVMCPQTPPRSPQSAIKSQNESSILKKELAALFGFKTVIEAQSPIYELPVFGPINDPLYAFRRLPPIIYEVGDLPKEIRCIDDVVQKHYYETGFLNNYFNIKMVDGKSFKDRVFLHDKGCLSVWQKQINQTDSVLNNNKLVSAGRIVNFPLNQLAFYKLKRKFYQTLNILKKWVETDKILEREKTYIDTVKRVNLLIKRDIAISTYQRYLNLNSEKAHVKWCSFINCKNRLFCKSISHQVLKAFRFWNSVTSFSESNLVKN